MQRYDFYFRQKVRHTELDSAFDAVENAITEFLEGFGYIGIANGADVVEHNPTPNFTVDVSGPGLVFDQLAQRIAWSADQNVDMTIDENGTATAVTTSGNEKWLSVFAEYDRTLSDPRTDGNGDTVFFDRAESFNLNVVQGVEAPTGTAVKPSLRSDQILLGDVLITYGMTEIENADIELDRAQYPYDLTGSPNAIKEKSLQDVLQGMLDIINPLGADIAAVEADIVTINADIADLQTAIEGVDQASWASNWSVYAEAGSLRSMTGAASNGNITCVAQSNSGNILYTYDYVNWTVKVVSADAYFSDIHYANGYWVLVGDKGGGSNNVFYATDPTGSWSSLACGTGVLYSVTYGNGYWTTVGASGALYYRASTPNGSWTANAQGSGTWYGVDFSSLDGYWGICGASGALRYRATDPTGSFTANDQGANDLRSICAGEYQGAARWVTCGSSNALYSTDDITGSWTARTSAAQSGATLYDVGFGAGVFAIASTVGTDMRRGMQVSTNGEDWTNKPIASISGVGYVTSVDYCTDRFVACSNNDDAMIFVSLAHG